MADTRWLEKRHQTWLCVKDVPRALQKVVGKKRFVVSLHTHDLSLAMSRRWEALASFEQTIQAARKASKEDTAVRAGLEWQENLRRLREGDAAAIAAFHGAWDTDRKGREVTPQETALDNAEIALSNHVEHVLATEGEAAASTLYQVAHGRATPLLVYVEEWLAEGGAKGPLRGRTKSQYRTDVGRLAKWARVVGIPETVEAFTKAVAGRYVRETIITPKVDPLTANRWISAASAYWRWMVKRTEIELNPWTGQSVAKGPRKGSDEGDKRPFTDAELHTLLDGDPGVELADLIRVAALSGMRLEEVYRLTVADCAKGWFNLRQSKTKAGIRRVPVHSALASIVERRCKGKTATAYLFHEPGQAKDGRERSMAASKRFGNYRQRLGVHQKSATGRSSAVDFHSLRRWFITAARQHHDQGMVAAIVGHQTGNLTDDTYSGGPSDERRRAVVESVKLP